MRLTRFEADWANEIISDSLWIRKRLNQRSPSIREIVNSETGKITESSRDVALN
ncbi:MAG: hypothetical protein F6K42_01595 [Leptolyngbya sp. SIO1D8]|nr:hypothetical protein [Leptolyngbya sp. SIO1D8]